MADSEPGKDDWLEGLANQLASLDGLYTTCVEVERGSAKLTAEQEEFLGIFGTVDPAQYLLLSTKLVSSIRDAFEELPQFARGRGLVLLRALQTALVALSYGNTTALVKAVAAQPGQDHVGQQIYKANAVFCVCLLESASMKNLPAREFVVRSLNQAGHRWKDGAFLNISSLYRWHQELRQRKPTSQTSRSHEYIEQKLRREIPKLGVPASLDLAKDYVRKMAENPVFSVSLSI